MDLGGIELGHQRLRVQASTHWVTRSDDHSETFKYSLMIKSSMRWEPAATARIPPYVYLRFGRKVIVYKYANMILN